MDSKSCSKVTVDMITVITYLLAYRDKVMSRFRVDADILNKLKVPLLAYCCHCAQLLLLVCDCDPRCLVYSLSRSKFPCI